MSRVGAIRATSPVDVVCPSPHRPGPAGRGRARRRTCSRRAAPSPCRRRRSPRPRARRSPPARCTCTARRRRRPGRHADDAAEVVDVAVRVDHRDDRPVTAVLAVQRQRRRRGLGRDQRVDDDHAGVALDEGDVRQVETAHLVDALDDLVQALLGDQRATAATGSGCTVSAPRRSRKCVGVVVPHDPAVGGGDHARLERGDEPSVGVLEVLVSSNGRVLRCSRWAASMVAVGGLLSMSAEIATRDPPPVLDWRNGCTPSRHRTR